MHSAIVESALVTYDKKGMSCHERRRGSCKEEPSCWVIVLVFNSHNLNISQYTVVDYQHVGHNVQNLITVVYTHETTATGL